MDCILRWSSSLTITQRVCLRFITAALPMAFAANSLLIKCLSTKTCFLTAVSSVKSDENAFFISDKDSTTGFTSFRTCDRSSLTAQPGKDNFLRLRANLIRLLMTISPLGPLLIIHSAGFFKIVLNCIIEMSLTNLGLTHYIHLQQILSHLSI